ncbi:MAG: hypothetical protein RR311_04055 [Comamonas sp.]
MDAKSVKFEKIIGSLHAKFGRNQGAAIAHMKDDLPSDALLIAFFHVSEFLSKKKDCAAHEKLLAEYLKEIFADGVCVAYLAVSGLDTPARVITRRILELGYVVLAYYDNPAKFWDWNSNDKDISFSELEAFILSEGYISFLSKVSVVDSVRYCSVASTLRLAYAELSNVVHPKPYNFSINFDGAFDFNGSNLSKVLHLQETVCKGLLFLLFCRFPLAFAHVEKIDPKLQGRLM